VREMTKTKAHGLLYKQLRTDSSFSRQGLPEYMMVFRKWAREEDAIEPVTHTPEDFPLDQWQKYASPVWMDTRETNVLNAIRAPGDEKHICPLPLDLIERSIKLYSNPNDVVLSPFMGIGSEGYGALKAGRRFIGTELKEEYWRQATRHLTSAEQNAPTLFDQLMGDAA
jgi:DNA modification methylase